MEELNIKCIKLGITACYLLKCKGGYILIDTGCHKYYKKFLKIIKRNNIDIKKIKYLLLTHHHDDHAGFASELLKDSRCRIIAHQRAVCSLKEGITVDSMRPLNKRIQFIFSLFKIFHGGFNYPPVILTDKDIILREENSNILQSIGVNGKILFTPGHSRDSISILLEDGNALVGDAAMNFLKPCGLRYRPIFLEDINEIYKSWTKLKQHGAVRIYPAHGKPFKIHDLLKYYSI